ncbi:MAG: endolytic transglycosylase MltG [Bacteroidaceae bacterium]|nr:endolytic transglycosylase MltG [Bacteroidaceae bacterium]
MRNPKTVALALLLLLAGVFVGAPFVLSFSSKEEAVVYIRKTDDWNKVDQQIKSQANAAGRLYYRLFLALTDYENRFRKGRYDLGQGASIVKVLRALRNGKELPVRLTLKQVRTMDELASFLADKLQPSRQEWLQLFRSPALLDSVGRKPETLIALFIPNTYEVYWSTTPQQFVDRMAQENKVFWNDTRRKQAEELGLSPDEVVTLASIVDAETQYDPEKAKVAGMYLNRLRIDMPLQADPTIKFALNDFGLRRILNKHLSVNSPYNTYRNKGLPPGPIRIPALSSIEGVLNAERHNYIYMCAKEDFSGSHNFATTYEEHLQNAQNYARALDQRGIKS